MTNTDRTYNCKWLPDSDKLRVSNSIDYVFFGVSDAEQDVYAGVTLDGEDFRNLMTQLRKIEAEYYTDKRADYNPPTTSRSRGYTVLGDQARQVLQHIRRAGSISAREAMNDYGITSATLARRVCDIEEAGYTVYRERRVHPITGKRYTRYAVADEMAGVRG